jgi:hypothetical protein
LRRDVAERLILEAVQRRILENEDWLKAIWTDTKLAWHSLYRTLPDAVGQAKQQLAEAERRIERLLDSLEDGPEDEDVQKRLEKRRTERDAAKQKLQELDRCCPKSIGEPTLDWVRERVDALADTLRCECSGASALRDLVGGRIVVEEVRQPGKKRHFLRGRFTIRTAKIVAVVDPALERVVENSALDQEIVLDFLPLRRLDQEAEEAKRLFDSGMVRTDIARRLGCCRAKVTKLMKVWATNHGEGYEDGRRQRWSEARRSAKPRRHKEIAEAVLMRLKKKISQLEIAKELQCSPREVRSAIKWWLQSHGCEMPKGKWRRGLLDFDAIEAAFAFQVKGGNDSAAA